MTPHRPLSVAVTGLNATDNPGPGVGVLRALKLDAHPGDRLCGLTYDALDPGVYAHDLVRDVFLLPYPSSNLEAFLERITYVHAQMALDVIVPTLDAELPAFIAMEPELRALGIAVLLPTRAQFELRAKANLFELGRRAGLSVPHTLVVTSADQLWDVHHKISYPFLVKGVFYGAKLVTCFEEALAAFHKTAAEWGFPVLVQERVLGDELNVVALGDGIGGLLGAVPMKKLVVTDKGKGWAGITIRDPELFRMTQRFMMATHWRGPCEIEVIRSAAGDYHVLEINPRFPAWTYLAAAAGMNLPRAAALMATGALPTSLHDYREGTMFVRIAIDQVAPLTEFEQVLTRGELHRPPAALESVRVPRGVA
jgi:carbamoyl-phosphate synthase large subunit